MTALLANLIIWVDRLGVGGASQVLGTVARGALCGTYASAALAMPVVRVCHNLDVLSNVLKHFRHIFPTFTAIDWAVTEAERVFSSSLISKPQQVKCAVMMVSESTGFLFDSLYCCHILNRK